MPEGPRAPKRWGVICENYVSLHEQRSDALLHAEAIKGGFCRADHRVELTDLPAGTRHGQKKGSK